MKSFDSVQHREGLQCLPSCDYDFIEDTRRKDRMIMPSLSFRVIAVASSLGLLAACGSVQPEDHQDSSPWTCDPATCTDNGVLLIFTHHRKTLVTTRLEAIEAGPSETT